MVTTRHRCPIISPKDVPLQFYMRNDESMPSLRENSRVLRGWHILTPPCESSFTFETATRAQFEIYAITAVRSYRPDLGIRRAYSGGTGVPRKV